jgi:Mu-like prophage I protein
MKIIQAIEKREDVSPSEGKSKYGDVKYADEKNKKYPIDSEAHVRAAWSYINMPKNAGKYSSEDVKTIKGQIKAAGKKYGIDFSDNGDKTESSLVSAASIDLEGETPNEIIYMPKGDWNITPMVGGKPKPVAVKVDENVATTLQADLARRLGQTIRPYASFDHKPGPASFIPKGFKWNPDRGVMLEVDWTQAGKSAVVGRDYSYFSPTFLLSDKGEVAGLPSTGEIGSLTNNPAFREIQKIAASADDDDEGEESKMVKLTDKLVELEVITAEQAADADEEFIVRAVTGLHEALATVQAANARLVSENTALAAKAIEVQKAEATSIVQAAIAEGKIPAKNQDAIDFWMGQLIANPEQAKKAMAATLQANPLLQKVIDVKVSDTKRVASGTSAADLVQAQHLAIHEIQEAHPNLSYTDAFNKAKREHPEVFLAES